MNRRLFGRAGLLAALGLVGSARAGEGAPRHRIALQVGVNDPALMNLALSQVETLAAHYGAAGEAVAVDLTALGPGYRMLRADASPVRARLAEIRARHPFVVFSACQAARAALAREMGRDPAAIPQVPEARDVPVGAAHLAELQERGWSYLRP